MPEYVYALYDFIPENEDELMFNAGERIEIVEKDELYGDGWWQVSTISPRLLDLRWCWELYLLESLRLRVYL